jgi:hypothetical protein
MSAGALGARAGQSASESASIASKKKFPLDFLATPFWAMPKRCSAHL